MQDISDGIVCYFLVSDENQLPSRGPSRVDFVPNTARPQPTMPMDLSKEEFLSVDDVQTSPLPKGQIGVVMSSYDKTIGKFVVFRLTSEWSLYNTQFSKML